MWREMLLQLLIALLPVFLFLVWYDRPDRSRRASLFLAIVCGVSMIVNMRLAMVLENGLHVDFRHIPLMIGSLYGGVAVGVFLTVLYAAARLFENMAHWEMLLLAAFVCLFVPVLIRCTFSFHKLSKARRFRISIILYGLLVGFYIVLSLVMNHGSATVFSWPGISIKLAYWAAFFAGLMLCLYFMELAFERVRLQQELRDMSLKYRGEMIRLQQFIDQAPLMVFILDSEGIVTHVNEESLIWADTIGLGRKDLLDKHFESLTRLARIGRESPVTRIIRGEERVVEMIDFAGRTFYTVTCAIKGYTQHAREDILFIANDVTELQQLKDEVGHMERLSLVGQMAASITHEIRNPMAVIRGFVQLLNERSPSEHHSYFRIVLEELDRANSIINDFLSLAQNRIVEMEPCDLHEVLGDLTPLLWADANMRGQMIEMKLSRQMDPLLLNSKEIKQLVLNLARNGMEAMNDSGILRIETVDLGDTVQLRVVDHGVGIAQEKIDRLFEPFYTTKTNGTGLGLALCLSIVERHNAKIQVESAVGEGTAFVVTFCKPGRHCW